MPEQSPTPSSRPWTRRTVLGGTGLAIAAGVAGCSRPEAGEEAEETEAAAKRLPAPDILTTAQWGALQPNYHLQTLDERPSYLVIHHTTTPNVTDGSREAAESIAKMVQNAHMSTLNDWGDTGQHFTVSRGGFALEGRHGSRYTLEQGQTFMLGVHALGFNAYALGIECEGLYTLNPPPQSLYAGLVPLAAYICQQYELPPSRIIGHRDVTATSCCGDAFYGKLPVLREDVRLSLATGEYHVSEGFGADNLFDDAHVTPDYLQEQGY